MSNTKRMSNTRVSAVGRTSPSKHAGVMRVSLFVSLGLSPLGCGGTEITASNGDAGSGAQAGTGLQGGGGRSFAGGSYGGEGGVTYGGGAPVSYGGGSPDGGTGGKYTVPHCDSPTFDPVTHLTRCANGFAHRPSAIACPYIGVDNGSAGEGGAEATGSGGGVNVSLLCKSDADCAALPLGYCDYEIQMVAFQCRAGCRQDSDCAMDQLCECDGSPHGGKCRTADCRVDGDCGPNSLCAPVRQPCSGNTFACTSSDDRCTIDADCSGSGPSAYCSNADSGYRSCVNAVCGRPFLVMGCPRLPEVTGRADWLDARVTPNMLGLTPLQRAELSAHWARLGQMEHASIAAFARFNLQLLSLGAPGELIAACNQALADETAHTRLCFALASQYGGTSLGPARLDIGHCFEDTSLEAIMKLVLREGCLGETVAALEAVEASAVATDPVVKSALSRIARDEQTHAELAYKFLAWALTQSSPEARTQLEREAQRALADFEAAALARPADPRRDSLASDGIIGAEALRAIHLGAVREVVEPLLSAILQQTANANHSALTRA